MTVLAIGIKLLSDAVLVDTFVEVPRVLTLPEFGYEADEVDITHLNSPGGVKEYTSGLKDGAGSTIEVIWDPANPQHTALKAKAESGATVQFQIQFPDTGKTQVELPLLLKSFKLGISSGDKITASFDVKVSGAATWGVWI